MAQSPPGHYPAGTEVELGGLSTAAMNGKRGKIAAGTKENNGILCMFVLIDGKKVLVKPTNVFPAGCHPIGAQVVIKGVDGVDTAIVDKYIPSTGSYAMQCTLPDNSSRSFPPAACTLRYPVGSKVEIKSTGKLGGKPATVVGYRPKPDSPNGANLMVIEMTNEEGKVVKSLVSPAQVTPQLSPEEKARQEAEAQQAEAQRQQAEAQRLAEEQKKKDEEAAAQKLAEEQRQAAEAAASAAAAEEERVRQAAANAAREEEERKQQEEAAATAAAAAAATAQREAEAAAAAAAEQEAQQAADSAAAAAAATAAAEKEAQEKAQREADEKAKAEGEAAAADAERVAAQKAAEEKGAAEKEAQAKIAEQEREAATAAAAAALAQANKDREGKLRQEELDFAKRQQEANTRREEAELKKKLAEDEEIRLTRLKEQQRENQLRVAEQQHGTIQEQLEHQGIGTLASIPKTFSAYSEGLQVGGGISRKASSRGASPFDISLSFSKITPSMYVLNPPAPEVDTYSGMINTVYEKHIKKLSKPGKDGRAILHGLLQREQKDGNADSVFRKLANRLKDESIIDYLSPKQEDTTQVIAHEIHDTLRSRHTSPPLLFNKQLAQIAWKIASGTASSSDISNTNHNVNTTQLNSGNSSVIRHSISEWYNKIGSDDHNRIVWRGSTDIGSALFCKEGVATVVCAYGPGNPDVSNLNLIAQNVITISRPPSVASSPSSSASYKTQPTTKQRVPPVFSLEPKTPIAAVPKRERSDNLIQKPPTEKKQIINKTIVPEKECEFTDDDGDKIRVFVMNCKEVGIHINQKPPSEEHPFIQSASATPLPNSKCLVNVPNMKLGLSISIQNAKKIATILDYAGVPHNITVDYINKKQILIKESHLEDDRKPVFFRDSDGDLIVLARVEKNNKTHPAKPASGLELEIGLTHHPNISDVRVISLNILEGSLGLHFPEIKKATFMKPAGNREEYEEFSRVHKKLYVLLEKTRGVIHNLSPPLLEESIISSVAGAIGILLIASEPHRQYEQQLIGEVVKLTGSPPRKARGYLRQNQMNVFQATSAIMADNQPSSMLSPQGSIQLSSTRRYKKIARPLPTEHRIFPKGWHLQFYRGELPLRGIGTIAQVHERLDRENNASFHAATVQMSLLADNRVTSALFPTLVSSSNRTGIAHEEAMNLGLDQKCKKSFLASYYHSLLGIGLEVCLKTGNISRPSQQNADAGWSRPAERDRFRILNTKEGSNLRRMVGKIIEAIHIFNVSYLAYPFVSFLVQSVVEVPGHLLRCKDACIKWVTALGDYADREELLAILSGAQSMPWKTTRSSMSKQSPAPIPVSPPMLSPNVLGVDTSVMRTSINVPSVGTHVLNSSVPRELQYNQTVSNHSPYDYSFTDASVISGNPQLSTPVPNHHHHHQQQQQQQQRQQQGEYYDSIVSNNLDFLFLAATALPLDQTMLCSALPSVRVEENQSSYRIIVRGSASSIRVALTESEATIWLVGDQIPLESGRILTDELSSMSDQNVMMLGAAKRQIQLQNPVAPHLAAKEPLTNSPGYTVCTLPKVTPTRIPISIGGVDVQSQVLREGVSSPRPMSPRRPGPALRVEEHQNKYTAFIRGSPESLSISATVSSLHVSTVAVLMPPFNETSTRLLIDELSQPFVMTTRNIDPSASSILTAMMDKGSVAPRFFPSAVRSFPFSRPVVAAEMSISAYSAGHTMISIPIMSTDSPVML